MPRASMRAIFSLAGLEKPHSSMLQVATESLQPHWHCNRMPTRRTSSEGFSEAVWASAAMVRMRSRRLFLKRRMRGHHAHHLGAGILHFDLAGDQADEGATDEHQAADPDPRNQREDISLNDGALVVVGHAAEVQVEILVEARADTDFGSALAAGQIEPLFGFELAEEVAVLGDIHGGAVPLVKGRFALLEIGGEVALLEVDHL